LTLDRRTGGADSRSVAGRLWGCYSVADHLERRAFVADLLLYDRLVVPVPSNNDTDRWEENGWDPKRQTELLKILGPFVERIEWSLPLRDQFQREWSTVDLAQDIDAPFGMTRHIISEQLDKLKPEAAAADARAVAVYAKPDRFDSDWKLTGAAPFLRKVRRVTPGALRERGEAASTDQQKLAKMIVTRLAIPDDGQTDQEVLDRTVDLVKRKDVAERRAAFQRRLAALASEGLRDETIVGEFQDDLDAYNAAVQSHTRAQRARVAVQILTTGQAGAGLWAAPLSLTTGPTAAFGEAAIERRWGGDPSDPKFNAVALLAEAQRALAD
jgi:hypothetical protein